MRSKYYSLEKILSKNCQYNMIIGERSNGKTYSVFEYGIKKFIETGEQFALIRRWADDFKGKRGQQMFSSQEETGLIKKYSKGEWTGVRYKSGMWFLSKFDEDLQKDVLSEKPMCFAFSLGSMEHDKSTSFNGVTTIVFDEFLTRGYYITDEFVVFMNCLSTIIRQRDNVKIFMLGNTVNKYSPYFNEMGLINIKNMSQGSIDVYEYGESNLKVAVEYCATMSKTKKSNTYFAFNNPKLHMITNGKWEINIYPHNPIKHSKKNVRFSYFVVFDENTLQCDIVKVGKEWFTFIHTKTTPIKNLDKDIIFSVEHKYSNNYRRNIYVPTDDIGKKILYFFKAEKVFYQDNEIGEIMNNYLKWCSKLSQR